MVLEWPDTPAQPATLAYARVETIGPRHRTTLYSVAARFGTGPLPLPDVPSIPLVDLSTAWRLAGTPESYAACLVLVERLRVIADRMLYATDGELTLMLRLTDRRGVPDTTRAILWYYLTPTSAPEWAQITSVWEGAPVSDPLWLQAPLYDADGWYGLQYRGPVPTQSLSLSLYHATLGPDLSTQPDRARLYGTVPASLAPTTLAAAPDGSAYAVVSLGLHQPLCPWDARSPAALVLTFTATAQLQPAPSYAQLQQAGRVLACNLSVPARRVALTLSRTGTLSIAVGLESFLRAYDVRLALLEPARLQALLAAAGLSQLSLPPSGLRSLAPAYAQDPPDPVTACPVGYYFTDAGTYQTVPAHATVGPDCYGFSCDRGYTLEPHAVVCVPEYVADWIFWTVVCLVSTMAFCVVLCACTLRLLCARPPEPGPTPEPAQEPEPEMDNTLPIAVTPDGNLLFEAILSSDSDPSSDSDTGDETYAELVPDTETLIPPHKGLE